MSAAITALYVCAAAPLPAQLPPTVHDTTARTRVATALRAQPDTAARIIASVAAGWPVHVSACVAGWCTVMLGEQGGYLRSDSLTLGAPPSRRTHLVAFGVDLSSRLTLAVWTSPHTRLQAEVSYFSAGSKSHGSGTTIGQYAVDGTVSELWVGAGVFLVDSLVLRPVGAPCFIYGGPRLGFTSVRGEVKVDNPTTHPDVTVGRSDFWLGAALGGELFLNSRFSIGAELQLTKLFVGSSTVSGVTANGPIVGEDWVDLQTNGTLVLRFYP